MNGKEENTPFQVCTDTSDCVELSFTSGLYLKPITKLSITVTIPHLKVGQVISNKEIIDKLVIAVRPEKFASIKATKSNLEFLRFDAELNNKKKQEFVISKIDQKGIKLAGFSEVLKIRATEGKVPFPSRHDWDSYFKEAKHMNEKKPGERPDTVHIKDIPCEWFIHNDDPTGSCPSEYVVSKVFSSFGELRALDIPYLDPYRKQMSAAISGVNKFSFTDGQLFDVYVQYKEYIGFAKCMHTLQAKKLVIQRDDTVFMATIKVDFDKTKHLSDAFMKRREVEREKIMSTSTHLREKSRMKKEIFAMKKDAELLERYHAEEKERKRAEEKDEKKKIKEEKRKQKELKIRLKKLMAKHKDLTDIEDMEGKLTKKIAIEERKLVITQRSVEAVRLFDKIFDRIKTYHQKETAIRTTLHASGIQSEPVLFGNWFNPDCQLLMKRKKILYSKFSSVKNNENWLHYKKCSHKLKKMVHNQKLKFIGSCLKNAKGVSNKEQDEQKRRELVSCKKVIKLSKARHLDQMQAQQNRVDKVMRGKIQVIFLPCDDENKVALSPASSGDSSSSSASSLSDDSDSDNDKKMFGGKLRSDQLETQDMYGNPVNVGQFQGNFYHNFRGRGAYGMGQGPHFPYDNRGRGFRYFRPYYNNRGFRGGPHQGFENRGRGFFPFRGRFPYDKNNRGRGGYIDYKKLNEHPIQLGEEKWFIRGNETEKEEEEQDYYKSKYNNRYKSSHRSPSWSDGRTGSRNRSRSWSRSVSKSYSRSRSGSEKRRSTDKSPRYSKKGGRRRSSHSSSRSSSNSRNSSMDKSVNTKGKISKTTKKVNSRANSEDGSVSKDKKKHKRSSSSEDSSRSRSRLRKRRSVDSVRSSSGEHVKRKKIKVVSRSRSSESSRAGSRRRERNIDERYSRSKSRNRYSERSYSRSASPNRYKKYKRGRTISQSYDEYQRDYYSGSDLSADDNDYGYQRHRHNERFVNRRYHNDFQVRGRGPRQFHNYRGNQRQRRPRGVWRGRGRGYFTPNYNQNDHDEDYNDQYLKLYRKYFNRISEKDSHKRNSSSEDESYKSKEKRKGPIDDMNARYREEEERSRVDKLQQVKTITSSTKKRNIRERLEDSEEEEQTKKRAYSTSDEDSLYGPAPPKHIKSRSRRV